LKLPKHGLLVFFVGLMLARQTYLTIVLNNSKLSKSQSDFLAITKDMQQHRQGGIDWKDRHGIDNEQLTDNACSFSELAQEESTNKYHSVLVLCFFQYVS